MALGDFPHPQNLHARHAGPANVAPISPLGAQSGFPRFTLPRHVGELALHPVAAPHAPRCSARRHATTFARRHRAENLCGTNSACCRIFSAVIAGILLFIGIILQIGAGSHVDDLPLTVIMIP